MQGQGGRLSPVPEQQPHVPGQKSRIPFTQKFHSLVQGAQEAQIKAAHQHELQDRRSLSVSMLVAGRAQAFVDFFMLTQPVPENDADVTAAAAADGLHSTTVLPWESMVLLQQQLVQADSASRVEDHHSVFSTHRNLAKHFTQLGMLENAVLFWKRSLQVAVAASMGPEQLEATCALGLLYESQGQPGLALTCHEQCLQLAQELQRPEDAASASAQLVQVYAQQAEQLGRDGDSTAAAASYLKCRDAAVSSGDMAAAGAAAHHLGLIAQQQGNWQEALEHQRAYLEFSRQAGDQEMHGMACAAYAECQHKLGQLGEAVEALEAFLKLSHSQAPRGQATACCKLGVLYHQQGKLEQAVAYFERFYELARSLGERRLLDLARVNLGAARAELKLRRYKTLAWNDLMGTLRWKCSRTPF